MIIRTIIQLMDSLKKRGIDVSMMIKRSLWLSAVSTFGLATLTAAIPHKTLATTQASTTRPVALYATTPQSRTGQGVTLMAATNTPLATGESFAIMNATTGQILNKVTSGTTVSTTVIHHSPQTDKFMAMLTKDSKTLAVSWVARPIGNSAGYKNAAGQSVALIAPSADTSGVKFTVTAEPTGFKKPVYQFWWAMQGGQWHSSGEFSSANSYTINPPRDGFLSTLVYARESNAPRNENADQQAVYEAKSDTTVIDIGNTSQTSANSMSPNSFVSLSLSNEVAVGNNISLTANATGITNPLYQFWFESPTGNWQSSGKYQSTNTFAVPATVPGPWHVVVYSRPLKAPENETATQRASLAVASPESTVTVHS